MKKIFTILLTLVMAMCLVNLNNSQTKAKDKNETTYVITFNGTQWVPTDPIPASLNSGDLILLQNTTGSEQQDTYVYNCKFNKLPIADTYIDVNNTGASVVIDNTNKVVYIADVPAGDPILFTRLTLNEVGVLEDHNIGSSKTVSFDTSDVSKNPFGIKYVAGVGTEPGTLTFTKSLICAIPTAGTSYPAISITGPLNIVLDDDISITGTAANNMIVYMNNKISIDGKGHILNLLSTDVGPTLMAFGELNLKDITFICKSVGTSPTVSVNDNFNLQGEVTIEITNTNTNGCALKVKSSSVKTEDINFAEDAKIKTKVGNTDGDKTKDTVKVHKLLTGTAMGRYVTDDTDTAAKYVKIVQSYKSPEPTPSPSEPVVKDESCEKVIGPTWHWNNTKGICEDYGVVGTSTR